MTNEELEKIKVKVREARWLEDRLEDFDRVLDEIKGTNWIKIDVGRKVIIRAEDLAYAQIVKILKEERKRLEEKLEEL